jgi:hypothetical protein
MRRISYVLCILNLNLLKLGHLGLYILCDRDPNVAAQKIEMGRWI